jgi:hypothetical protein
MEKMRAMKRSARKVEPEKCRRFDDYSHYASNEIVSLSKAL